MLLSLHLSLKLFYLYLHNLMSMRGLFKFLYIIIGLFSTLFAKSQCDSTFLGNDLFLCKGQAIIRKLRKPPPKACYCLDARLGPKAIYCAVKPPSTVSTVPTAKRASSEAR